MNIGQAASRCGVTAKMIRYYESIGLIPRPQRTGGNYRDYAVADVQRLKFVRGARDLGFPVERIRDLVNLWTDRNRCSSEVKALVLAHIEELEDKIAQMREMAATLHTLADACEGNDKPDCAIIDGLDPNVKPTVVIDQRRRTKAQSSAKRQSAHL